MLERLEGAFESQRRFVANASHELRTPLAIVRTELDVTLDDPAAPPEELRAMALVVRDANDRMERLIASLLALASSEVGIVHPRPVDLADVVAPALEREEAFGPDGAQQLQATLDSAPVLGDAVLLERLAANLVENAVRYNAAVGWVRVRTGIVRGEATLEVVNPGVRIDSAEAQDLLEPFRRLESSRARSTGGYGLGLAVVRAVAQAHGGRVAVLARREGGLDVTVSLPLSTALPGEMAAADVTPVGPGSQPF
jgi:signal transduction histidine kinase